MYKKLLPSILVFISYFASGQVTINSNNFPVGGLKINRGYCLTSQSALGSPGPNQFYDLTGITPVYHDTIKYYQASQTPWASYHPGATVATAVSSNGLITIDYYTAGASSFRRTGQTLIGNLGGGNDTIHATYSPEDTLLRDNYTYGYTGSTRAKATYFNFLAFANLERTTIRSFFFDGWGSLQTPLNYYGDVLRMKGAEINYDTAFYFGSPVYTAADTQYYYKYYAKDVRHPVVTAHTDKHFNLQYLEYIFSPPVITGCMDTMAQNYNPLANSSDGSCIYCNVNFTITPDTTICSGSSIDLTVSGGNSYLWQDGTTAPILSVAPIHSSTYSVYVSSTPGCHALANVQVNVDEPVSAVLWTSVATYHAGDVVQFVNLSTNATQYYWDFDEQPSGTSTLQYPLYTYSTPGIKDIILVASNTCYADTGYAQITITEASSVLERPVEGTLSIYPNPGTDRFTLNGMLAGTGNIIISITDMQGRTGIAGIIEQAGENFSHTANVNELPDGLYIIEIRRDAQCIRYKWLKTK